jgi:hypothetical protein
MVLPFGRARNLHNVRGQTLRERERATASSRRRPGLEFSASEPDPVARPARAARAPARAAGANSTVEEIARRARWQLSASQDGHREPWAGTAAAPGQTGVTGRGANSRMSASPHRATARAGYAVHFGRRGPPGPESGKLVAATDQSFSSCRTQHVARRLRLRVRRLQTSACASQAAKQTRRKADATRNRSPQHAARTVGGAAPTEEPPSRPASSAWSWAALLRRRPFGAPRCVG